MPKDAGARGNGQGPVSITAQQMSDSIEPYCAHKEQLIAAHTKAASEYSDALNDLREQTGRLSRQEYERYKRRVDAAKILSDESREAVDTHRQAHGC